MTQSGPAPEDLEAIAAFIDQRLSGAERDEFMRRLDDEEALYEVFVETVRCRDEAKDDELAPVVEHSARWRVVAPPVALAAALALAVGIVLLRPQNASFGEALVAEARLGEVLTGDWYEHGWPTTRGINPGGGEDVRFRLGVRLVDLEVALRSERRQDASILATRVVGLLQRIELSEPLQLRYQTLRRQIVDGTAPPRELLAETQESARLLADYLGDGRGSHELGRWVETGRLAAASGNIELLTSRGYRAELRRLRRGEWTGEVEAALDRISGLLAAPASDLDTAALESAYLVILAAG